MCTTPNLSSWKQLFETPRSEGSRVASELAARGRAATDRAARIAADLAEQTRRRGEVIPDALGALQRRLNVLGLATKHDVVVHSQLIGVDVYAAIDELIESNRYREKELQGTVRREVQQELRALGLANTRSDVAPPSLR